MTQNRCIGLDVGTKRIGVALSDPLLITAQPNKTISRQPEVESVKEIKNLVTEYNVDTIVVGLPKNMNGTIGPQANDVVLYSKLLEKEINIKIVFEDERLSSKSAERFLIEQKKKPFKNKGLIDVASAAIILQQYLDKRR